MSSETHKDLAQQHTRQTIRGTNSTLMRGRQRKKKAHRCHLFLIRLSLDLSAESKLDGWTCRLQIGCSKREREIWSSGCGKQERDFEAKVAKSSSSSSTSQAKPGLRCIKALENADWAWNWWRRGESTRHAANCECTCKCRDKDSSSQIRFLTCSPPRL